MAEAACSDFSEIPSPQSTTPNPSPRDSLLVFRNIQPDFSLDGYNTHVHDHPVTLTGLRGGISWRSPFSVFRFLSLKKTEHGTQNTEHTFRAGIGYYFMASRPYEPAKLGDMMVNARLRFRYVSLYAEQTFYESRKWQLNAGLRPGFGQLAHVYAPAQGASTVFNKRYFPLIEPYVSGHYRIIPELGLSGGLGYRAAPFAPSGTSYGWVSLGVAVFWGKVWEEAKALRMKNRHDVELGSY